MIDRHESRSLAKGLCSALLMAALLGLLLPAVRWAEAAVPEKRVALVMGNSEYTGISPLANSAKDAKLMAGTLRELGFDVVEALNVDRRGMARSIRDFGTKLREAGSEGVGLFYYAGHGVQARGENYIIPVEAQIATESDLEIETITINSILAQMRDANNLINIVILDACRNNPFAGTVRSGSRGLARVSAEGGSMIAFAAAPGQVASDGAGENSPYTTALAKAMRIDGLTIEQVFKRVLVDVEQETDGEQIPWVQSSLRGDFYFKPREGNAEGTPRPVLPPEISAWTAIKDTSDTALIETFLQEYPNGLFAEVARLRLDALRPAGSDIADTAPLSMPGQPQKLASLGTQPGTTGNEAVAMAPAPVASTPSPEELARSVQEELNRLGCDAGTPDGKWGRNSSRALERLTDAKDLRIASLDPSPEILDRLRTYEGRVCPLQCSITEIEKNGACIAKTCPAGQRLSSRGQCYTPRKKTASRPAGSGGSSKKCFVLVDETICE